MLFLRHILRPDLSNACGLSQGFGSHRRLGPRPCSCTRRWGSLTTHRHRGHTSAMMQTLGEHSIATRDTTNHCERLAVGNGICADTRARNTSESVCPGCGGSALWYCMSSLLFSEKKLQLSMSRVRASCWCTRSRNPTFPFANILIGATVLCFPTGSSWTDKSEKKNAHLSPRQAL